MRLVAERRQTVILVTHDPAIAALAGRTIRMRDGRIESDQRNGAPAHAAAPTPPLSDSPAGAVSQ
jgi:ABC-type lipoprotein export system ATPase subunit